MKCYYIVKIEEDGQYNYWKKNTCFHWSHEVAKGILEEEATIYASHLDASIALEKAKRFSTKKESNFQDIKMLECNIKIDKIIDAESEKDAKQDT